MPYIPSKERELFDLSIHCLNSTIQTDGQLNYVISRLVIDFAKRQGGNYAAFNKTIGVLECAKLELYSRAIVGYEALKERENGDVYDTNASDTNLAWAGGFFEGEGCFYAHYYTPRENGSRVYRTQASLSQKDEGLLNQFCHVVKCGLVYQDDDIWVWKTTKVGEAAQVFHLLRPYLGKRRQRRFLELDAGEKLQVFRPPKPPRTHCSKGHDLDEVGRRKDGVCAECDRQYKREYYHKHKPV